MFRVTVAIIVVALALALEALSAAYLPAGYTIGLSLLVPLAAFAAVAWAFVPDRRRAVRPVASHDETRRRSMRKTDDRPAA